MKPLILITNDDGINAKGLRTLQEVASSVADVVVMAPMSNASGTSHSITSSRPLRVLDVCQKSGLTVYCCDGTPVDCVKLALERFCPRRPNLVLSGINHGSNSSINILYSGTMGAVLEASTLGFSSIGFSLLNHNPEADFMGCIPFVKKIINTTLEKGLPSDVALNVNIPRLAAADIKGIRVCREAKARWEDSFEKRVDPQGRPYWWLTGKFKCADNTDDCDEWALAHGYVSVVPVRFDFTNHSAIGELKNLYQ